MGDLAQVALQRDVVDLHDDAVDVVVDLGPPIDPGDALGGHLLDRLVAGRRGVHPKALRAQPLERLPVTLELDPLAVADLVAPDVERPLRGLAKVDLPAAARAWFSRSKAASGR